MHMRRRLLAFGLFTVLPALTCAQESKLVNCRTLEAAGNFVGPDEVIVDDMVCQKAKPGAYASTKPQTQKPVIGTVVSDSPVDNVVDAAKAAEKRVAIRREQEASRNTIVPPTDNVPPAASALNTTTTEAPVSTAAAPSVAPTLPPPAPTPEVESTPQSAPPLATLTTASSANIEVTPPERAAPQPIVADAKTETANPPEPASAPASAIPITPAKAESPSSSEIVISSAPASAPSVAPAPAPVDPAPAPPARAATVAAPASPAEAVPAAPDHPATSSGFYDANAPKHNTDMAPQANTGFASADQVNAGLTPGATSIPQSAPPASGDSASTVAAAPEAEAQDTTIAASRIDFDADRDRSVKLGDFAKPHEVSPDPNAEHRTSVDPSDADGFQDRQRPDCTKNITLAGLSGGKLVLGVPSWAAKWIGKNENRMPQICFSETPMKNARNYLIVFSTPAGQVSKEAADAAVNPAKGTSAAGVGTFTTLYGSTWHYSFDRNVGTTILTQDDADEPQGAPGQVLFATAYTEEGVPVAQRWPGQAKKEIKANEKNPKKLKGETEALEHVSSDLLSQMVEDIEKL